MPNFAHATIIGHLGRDVELADWNGTPYATCAVATNRKRKGQDIVTWWRVTLWGARSKVLAQYLKKGDPVLFFGEPFLDQWQGQDGTERTTLSLHAYDFEFLGGKPSRVPVESQPGKQVTGASPTPAEFDDDIPF